MLEEVLFALREFGIIALYFFVIWWLSAEVIGETVYLNDTGKTRSSGVYSFFVTLAIILSRLLLISPVTSVLAMSLAVFVILLSLVAWVVLSGPGVSEIGVSRALFATILFFLLWLGFAFAFASFIEGLLGVKDVTRIMIWYYNLGFLVLIEVVVWIVYLSRLGLRYWRAPVVIIGWIAGLIIFWRMFVSIVKLFI